MIVTRSYDHIAVRFVRCANCNTRHALAKPLRDYVRIPRCRSCGRRHWWQDAYREKRRARERAEQCNPGRCGCGAYHYPHRRGSGWCVYNASITDDMLAERGGYPLQPAANLEPQPCPF